MRKAIFATLLAASGCATVPPNSAHIPGETIPIHGEVPGSVCRESADSSFIGQQATSELGARMLAATGARTLRWVPHGAMITMEFSPSRLTVRLDPQNRVLSANCG